MKTHIITTIIIIAAIFIPYALGSIIQHKLNLKEELILNWLYGTFTLGLILLLILIYAKLRTEIKDLIE